MLAHPHPLDRSVLGEQLHLGVDELAVLQHVLPRLIAAGVAVLRFEQNRPRGRAGSEAVGFTLNAAVLDGGEQVTSVTLHTAGVAESVPADLEGRDEILDMLLAPTMLKRTATFADVADVAAFAASDRARTITAASINITCGSVAD